MYFHPKDTTELMKLYLNKNECAHLAYGLHYAALIKNKEAQKGFDESKASYNIHASNRKNIERTLENMNEVLIESFAHYQPLILRGHSTSKLLVGMGHQHVLDTSITIHTIYGVPYIPSSSIKGLVRYWVCQAYFNGKDPFDKKAKLKLEELNAEQLLVYQLMADLFGTQERSGLALFYDVLPNSAYTIEQDIMAPHYGSYYGGKRMPTDDDRVVPIGGLRALVSSTYDCRFAVKRLHAHQTAYYSHCKTDELLAVLASWTENMLLEQGLGAKTTSGYGQFTAVTNVTAVELEAATKRVEKLKAARKQLKEKRKADAALLAKKRAQEVAEAQKKAEKEAQLQALTEDQRLVIAIQDLDVSKAADVELSKTSIYQQTMDFANNGLCDAAKALYEFWKEAGQLKVNKKSKQFEKVNALKHILEK